MLEEHGDLVVVLVDLAGQVFIQGEQAAKAHEGGRRTRAKARRGDIDGESVDRYKGSRRSSVGVSGRMRRLRGHKARLGELAPTSGGRPCR